ncbi:MAG TPA: NfeD family protein [Crenotrichaceae bacterium]|nr:NfeD family protein [Crenotrichaceae bacterium]
MNIDLLYWHWLLLGIVLITAEMFMPTFTILWFGLGALVVGLVLWIIDVSLSIQLLTWFASSIVFAIMWFKFLKLKDKTTAGDARKKVVGEFGHVIKVPTEESRGKVRFVIPILGDDEWEFVTEDKVQIGDRVRIKDISGNTLIVIKHI